MLKYDPDYLAELLFSIRERDFIMQYLTYGYKHSKERTKDNKIYKHIMEVLKYRERG